jgi:hypothetical protein
MRFPIAIFNKIHIYFLCNILDNYIFIEMRSGNLIKVLENNVQIFEGLCLGTKSASVTIYNHSLGVKKIFPKGFNFQFQIIDNSIFRQSKPNFVMKSSFSQVRKRLKKLT